MSVLNTHHVSECDRLCVTDDATLVTYRSVIGCVLPTMLDECT